MSETELKQVKQRILDFRKVNKTPEAYLHSLQRAGIVDARGKLTAPYRSTPSRSKSK